MFLGDSWEGAEWGGGGWHAGALTWAHALSNKYAELAVGMSQNTQTVDHWGWGGVGWGCQERMQNDSLLPD